MKKPTDTIYGKCKCPIKEGEYKTLRGADWARFVCKWTKRLDKKMKWEIVR